MSRAYRKWKEDIKAYRRGELPRCQYDFNILRTDTSMAAYRTMRRIRQRVLREADKRMRTIQGIYSFGNTTPDPDWHKHFLDTSGYPEYWKEDKQ